MELICDSKFDVTRVQMEENVNLKMEMDNTNYHELLKEVIDNEYGALEEKENLKIKSDFSTGSIKKEDILNDLSCHYDETGKLPSYLDKSLSASTRDEMKTNVIYLQQSLNNKCIFGHDNSFKKEERGNITFQQRPSIVSSLTFHGGEKPYKCKICPADFSYKSSLDVHQSVHKVTKSQKCSICSAAFYDKPSLTRHQRVHLLREPYNCDICEISFSNNFSLILHQTVHNGEKPYKCKYCPEAFHYKTHLLRHKRLHLRKYCGNFYCEICSAEFPRASELEMHFRRHILEKNNF